jgi:hypothetical protein
VTSKYRNLLKASGTRRNYEGLKEFLICCTAFRLFLLVATSEKDSSNEQLLRGDFLQKDVKTIRSS